MNINRAFLLIEGVGHNYPTYARAKVHLQESDPTSERIASAFYCSPVFSVSPDGVVELPIVRDGTVVSFFMVPSAPKWLGKLETMFDIENRVWFSLGIANIIVFDPPSSGDDVGLGHKIEQMFKNAGALTAVERWVISENAILQTLDVEPHPVVQVLMPKNGHLPLHARFTILEYFSTAEQVLTAATVFTPHYATAYRHIFDAGADLVSDLSYLYGGSDSPASSYLLDLDLGDARALEDHINDRSGRLVQLVSALSYIHSQSYFGAFPLLGQSGIICRYSLLGVGSAISALFEIVSQLEEAFSVLPFEEMFLAEYAEDEIPSTYVVFDDPRQHNEDALVADRLRDDYIRRKSPKEYRPLGNGGSFFGRFAFFSGRLGFREYDYSATAALQVLVEAASLRWNVINYTHEIIHNHVRIILDRVIVPPGKNFDFWCKEQIQKEKQLFGKRLQNRNVGLNRSDYIRHVLVLYSINSEYYGSLSRKWNSAKYDKRIAEMHSTMAYILPTASELAVAIRSAYRDISEIFVHVLDFNYIYKQDLEIYVDSLWSSWATITEVWEQLDNYILRTLLVVASLERGNPEMRFLESVKRLIYLMDSLRGNRPTSIFERVYTILQDPYLRSDFEHRFINCLPVADVARSFFIGKIETFLDRNDKRVLPRTHSISTNNSLKRYYDVERGQFDARPILSKVRLALDQLINTVQVASATESEANQERTSAWLLLCLGAYEHD